jgi:hypothetical protein
MLVVPMYLMAASASILPVIPQCWCTVYQAGANRHDVAHSSTVIAMLHTLMCVCRVLCFAAASRVDQAVGGAVPVDANAACLQDLHCTVCGVLAPVLTLGCVDGLAPCSFWLCRIGRPASRRPPQHPVIVPTPQAMRAFKVMFVQVQEASPRCKHAACCCSLEQSLTRPIASHPMLVLSRLLAIPLLMTDCCFQGVPTRLVSR